jgi:hypothetical protein
MDEFPQGIDTEVFDDLHMSLAAIGLSHVLERPAELWEMIQLVKTDRAMVRGEVYRYDGLREAYRAVGIARTIIQKLNDIRDRTGPVIEGLRKLLSQMTGTLEDPETREFVIAFIAVSPKGRDAVAHWIADPVGKMGEASRKVTAIGTIVEGYQKALRAWKTVPPPPSSPLDKENRPQLTPRFQKIEPPLEGPLIPPAPVLPPVVVSLPDPSPKPVDVDLPTAVFTLDPEVPEVAVAPLSPVSLILPRGVNPEVLEEIQRVDRCQMIFRKIHRQVEVWEIFCLVMLDSERIRPLVEQTLLHKKRGDAPAFTEGALKLFDLILKIRTQHGEFVRDLCAFLDQIPVGSFGKETVDMALGFIVASGRGRDRAKLWLSDPKRYSQEAAGRFEDVVSRTMNYQTALRSITP